MIRHSSSQLRANDFSYIARIAQDNFPGEGRFANFFRQRLISRFGRNGAVLTNNGTAALEIALHLMKQESPGRRYVIVSAYVCPAVVNAIEREGLKPLFADVQAKTLNLDLASVRERVDERTLAIVCTHLGGIPDDCIAAERMGVPVISDCAQGIGACLESRDVTQYGRLAVLSFGSTKPFTAGAGGALMVHDETLYQRAEDYARSELPVEHYRDYGFEPTYGQHFPDVNAGLGLAQLKRFDALIRKRRQIAQCYDEVLAEVSCRVLLDATGKVERNGYRYYLLSDDAPRWLSHLRQFEIDTRPSIAHDMTEYFPDAGYLPHIRYHASRVVSVPIHPAMSAGDVQKVMMALRQGLEMGLQ